MTYTADINVLILCHYHAGKQSLFHEHDMLDDLAAALRARGFSGRILEFSPMNDVMNDPKMVTALAIQQMKERDWKPMLDVFQVAIGSFQHSICIFGAEEIP